MTRPEAIEFLQKFSKAFEKYPIHGDVRAPFHEAIALAVADMEAMDKTEQWKANPTCPICGGPVSIYSDGVGMELGYCDNLQHALEVAARYKVEEIHDDPS